MFFKRLLFHRVYAAEIWNPLMKPDIASDGRKISACKG